MADLKIVIGTKEGKSYQKELKDQQAEFFHGKRVSDTVGGDQIGLSGYEFLITGGSDKCGFPMRKGIQMHRKKVFIGKSVGFSGQDRMGQKQAGLLKKRTVCGERITRIITQVNLKVTKEGAQPLGGEEAKAEKEKKE